MSNEMYSVKWEELPVEIEKYIVIILPLLQKNRSLTGYGILTCDWLTFASVLFDIGSYILTISVNFYHHFRLSKQLFHSFYFLDNLSDFRAKHLLVVVVKTFIFPHNWSFEINKIIY